MQNLQRECTHSFFKKAAFRVDLHLSLIHIYLTSEMKVAAQIGTTEGDYVQELADAGTIGQAVVLNKTTDCILQLQNGDVDAVITVSYTHLDVYKRQAKAKRKSQKHPIHHSKIT